MERNSWRAERPLCKEAPSDFNIVPGVAGSGAAAAHSVVSLLPQQQYRCELNRAEQSPALVAGVFVKTAGHVHYYHRELQAGPGFKLQFDKFLTIF